MAIWIKPRRGFEPPTYGLQNHCSTVELPRQIRRVSCLYHNYRLSLFILLQYSSLNFLEEDTLSNQKSIVFSPLRKIILVFINIFFNILSTPIGRHRKNLPIFLKRIIADKPSGLEFVKFKTRSLAIIITAIPKRPAIRLTNKIKFNSIS